MVIIEERQRRRVIALLLVASVIMVAYWAAWFVHRSLVASSTGTPYVWFENAFPAADAFLVVVMLLGARALAGRRPTTLLWLLLGSGGGLYLFFMDVLYDVEHGIWGRGTNGLVELAINIVTLCVALFLGQWSWRRRAALLAGD